MKIFLGIVPVVMCVLLGLGHAAAQSATVSGDLLTDWQQQKRMMMAIAEAMPEETFSFKQPKPNALMPSKFCTSRARTCISCSIWGASP